MSNFKTSYWEIQLPILGGNKSDFFFSSYQTTIKGSFYGLIIWSPRVDTCWSKIWLFALLETASRRIFYQPRDFMAPHVRHRLLRFADWVLFFFPSPCNTVFNRGKQRTCCLRDKGAGLSSARLSPRWALLLWSPGKMRTLKLLVFKDLLMQRRGFHLGSSTWMKTKVSSGVRRNPPLGPQRYLYLYMWDRSASSPFFNLCRSSRRGGGEVLTRCSEVKGHMSYTWPGPPRDGRSGWLATMTTWWG